MVNIYKTVGPLKEPYYNLVRTIVCHAMDATFLDKVINSELKNPLPGKIVINSYLPSG